MSQIKSKFVGADQIDDTDFRSRNNQYVRARNAANSADINVYKVNASDIIEFAFFPEKSGSPTTANQLVNKAYVDAALQGLDPKGAVRAATLVAGTLATSFENGDIIDGVTLATGDRILIKNQASALENGIYTVNVSGAPTRAFDMDASSEVSGAYTFIQEGSQAGQGWVQSGAFTTLETDAINFVFFNSVGTMVGGDMITVTGSTISVDLHAVSGLESSTGTDAGELRIKLEASNPTLQIDGSNQLGAKLDAAGAIITGASGIKVKVNAATLKINGSNELEGIKPSKENLTLNGTDITNQYKDLAQLIVASSLNLSVDGVTQYEGSDYTLSTVLGVTRITFAGDLATAGAAALVSGDILRCQYQYL